MEVSGSIGDVTSSTSLVTDRYFPMRIATKFWKFKRITAVWLFFAGVGLARTHNSTPEPTLRLVRIEELSKPVLALDIANDSDLAAVALSDLHVRVWRLSSGQLVHEFSFPEPPTDQNLKLENEVEPISLNFSPDGKILGVAFLNTIYLYNVKTWEETRRLSVAWEDKLRPDITATRERPQLRSRTAEQAQTQSEQPIGDINQTMRKWTAERHQGDGRTRISDFTFARGEQLVLASYCRGACWVWPGVRRDRFPSGTDPVRLWNAHSAKTIWENAYDPKGVISRVVPLPDGNRFLAANSQLGHCAVGAFGMDTGQALWSHSLGPCDQPPSILVLPDGLSFITNRVDEANRENRKKKLWRYPAIYETSTGKKIVNLPEADGIFAADISSDGHWLVSIIWRETQFQIWDLQTKKIIMRDVPKGWKRNADCVLNRVRLSPDNHWLVVGCNVRGDMAVYQWGEAQNRKP
jgi:WD40 repeat protein